MRFNPPPGWFTPPPPWMPDEGWRPDPSWPAAPEGWQFWVDEPHTSVVPVRRRPPAMLWAIGAAVLVALVVAAGVIAKTGSSPRQHSDIAGRVVGFTPDGSLVTADGDRSQIRFWNFKTGQETRKPIKLSFPGGTAISRDGQSVAVASDGCSAHVAPCPQSYFDAGGSGSRVRVYSVASGQQRCVVEQADDSPYNIVFNPAGTLLALSGAAGAASLWDANSCQLIARLKSPENVNVTVVAFSPDGNTLAGAGTSEYVDLWNTTTHDLDHQIQTGQTGNMRDAAFSPDGRLLATASNDGTVRLWDTASHEEIGAPIRPSGDSSSTPTPVSAIAFSTDGATLATSGVPHGIYLWDIRSGQPRNAPAALANLDVVSFCFSPDGTVVATYMDTDRFGFASAPLT